MTSAIRFRNSALALFFARGLGASMPSHAHWGLLGNNVSKAR